MGTQIDMVALGIFVIMPIVCALVLMVAITILQKKGY